MKKLTLFTLSLLCTASLWAQRSINIGDFDSIKVYDLIRVKLVPSSENKIEIQGEQAEEVSYILKDGLLKLRMDFDSMYQGEDNIIVLYYKNIDTIDANEGAIISWEEEIAQNELIVKVQEGAQITGSIEVDDLDGRAVTGGILSLTGKADRQDLVINTGGIVENKELISNKVKVKVQAGGEVEVYAKEYIDASVRAGGEIIIYGQPKNVKRKTLLGGEILMK